MWTTTHQATTSAPIDAVWAALEALHHGEPLGPASDHFELHGPFAVGTTVTVTPQGQDPLDSVIVDLEPGRHYADQTVFGDLTLTFRHVLTPTDDGGTHVRHTLVVEGPGSDEIGPELGPQIAGDFPVTMDELFAAAARRAATADATG
ncbi:SRPBCC family protein [Williamsia deligens]|uniref:SRPBCC family protein n=1 Tax=Williamsia deligens TaxID=321325 RepID=A0ABW3G993_9NOCA|nr:hypothetical protein [Williamsia deligens]MCP2195803.1 Polyketide cyclase / dehydrase and lipid transport [Williamsia deligens]